MITFNNFPGIFVLSVMLASIFSAAAPTPSSEKAAVNFILGDLPEEFRDFLPAEVVSFYEGLQDFIQDDIDSAFLSSLRVRTEGENEGFLLPSVGTIANKHGTVVFKRLRRDVELQACKPERRVEEQATENLDFNRSGGEISHFIDSLSSQVPGRAKELEDNNLKDGFISEGVEASVVDSLEVMESNARMLIHNNW